MTAMLPRDVEPLAQAAGAAAEPEAAAAWLFSPAADAAPVRRYRFYLKWMYETLHAVEECFPERGAEGAPARGTSAVEMLDLAHRLYVLDSFAVPGAVLECGAFKGFSSCCLSHACSALGRKLVVADSFAGLPEPGALEAPGYTRGEFRGGIEEVRAALAAFGRPECVELVPGWFRESLAGWTRPLAMLWLDVDLYASARDVLENVLPALDPRGAIFSHEFLPDRVAGGRIAHEGEPPGAIHDALAARGVDYTARFLRGWTAIVRLPETPAPGAEEFLEALLPRLRDLDHRARSARSAIGLRPALRDAARRALRRPADEDER